MVPESKWIRIDVQKPPEAETVIVYLESGRKTLGFRISLNGSDAFIWKIYNYEFSGIEEKETVLFWMPLPPDPIPPRETISIF